MFIALLMLTTVATSLAFAASPLTEGNLQSPVRVIIYEDLQCSDCAAFALMMEKHILPKYAGKAAFEHRDFPLPKHAWARKATIASRYFESIKPELALEYRRVTMKTQADITPDNFNDKLAQFAKTHGVEPEKALAALKDHTLAAGVEKDFKEAVARGVGKTPTVLVDGEPFIESFTFQDIAASLDKATKSKP
jgi:protein-disulfide isomerase